MPEDTQLQARARKIKLFLMDVDGTLTDGGVCLMATPGVKNIAELKVFNSRDGAGLKLARIMGIRTGFITGRSSEAVRSRARELSVDYVHLGQENKMAAFEQCLKDAGVTVDQTAWMGDDLPDLPLARRAGLAVAVADAAPELKAACHYTTVAAGGRGAAREVIELILKAQGRWEEAVPKSIA
ncbi:MAG: HAD hydrolase family protein [Acidobacteriaceae bacterium]